MINKNISDISYDDIKSLLENEIDESDIIEYKITVIEDQDIIKQVCAFANTRGGDLIFGIKESGQGGYPTEITGLNTSDLNKERLEQIILSNIVPRLDVKFKSIKIPNTEKCILLIRIPDSYQKPHQNNRNKKFYKRFQFESQEMTESEISDRYRSRFSNYIQVNQYVKEVLEDVKEDTITVNMLVIPSNIEHRIIDASNYDEIEKLQSINVPIYYQNGGFPNHPLNPFSNGLISRNYYDPVSQELRIHRNGCIHYVDYYKKRDDVILLPYEKTATKLMQTLQFTSTVLSNYNYFGDVKIILTLTCSSNNMIPDSGHDLSGIKPLDSLNAIIEREYSMYYIETKYEQITSSIMNEIFNHYGGFRCPLFDEKGNYDGYGGRKRER